METDPSRPVKCVEIRLYSLQNEYGWSSHQGYLSTAKSWQWLAKDLLLDMLAGEKDHQLEAFKHRMVQDHGRK